MAFVNCGLCRCSFYYYSFFRIVLHLQGAYIGMDNKSKYLQMHRNVENACINSKSKPL